ncbi:MAG: DUF1998 domain-containing protein [Albidovulum sp.]|nr:DUF1998 domain-containing protein [Albidovulum sp.]
MTRARSIRRAQAIYPYGPGAILDLGQESFVVMDTASNSFTWTSSVKIRLPRLELRGRANAPDGFRLPPLMSNDRTSAALKVQRFPAWLFCPKCRRMWRWGRQQEIKMSEQKQELPRCQVASCGSSILVPMRYIAACSKGHLMDVDWWSWAHSRSPRATGTCDRANAELSFFSDGLSGSSLRSLRVKCRKCSASRNLEDLQRLDPKAIGQRCTGRQPWQSRDNAEECTARLRVLLRSETSVHYAEIDSALDLEEGSDESSDDLLKWLKSKKCDEIEAVDEALKLNSFTSFWSKHATSELGRKVSSDEIMESLERIFEASNEDIGVEVNPFEAEWAKLSRPSPERNQNAPLLVASSGWEERREDGGSIFQLIGSLMLVERLREVRALKGFSRVDPPGGEDTKNRLFTPDLKRVNEQSQRWKPAIEVFGEGIFIGFPEKELKEWERSNSTAFEARLASIFDKLRDSNNWIANRFGDLAAVLPRFILVHTFSHVFMRQLSYEAGYNSASIRERLYVFPNKAGVLIYTADGDSEGSLGGLVRQGKLDRAPDTIKAAIERSAWCSNDPICIEMPSNGLEGMNHVACHACCLVPETSCSHLNVLLDRQMIVGEGGGATNPVGYFAPML